MGKMLNAPASTFAKLNWIWVIFLLALGALNLYVAFNYSENDWVNFKLFGVTSMMFVFMGAQIYALRRYLVEPPATRFPPTKNKK